MIGIVLVVLICLSIFEGFLPMSGSEPKYEPSKWNIKGIKKYNNCYSYLLDDPKAKNKKKIQPGYFSGIQWGKINYDSCGDIWRRLRADNPEIYSALEEERCRRGFYKGYLVLDQKKHDYHFYRQDDSGIWSHKPGSHKVRQYDGEFQVILNPRTANHRNAPYYYRKKCGYLCVPNR
jgi:hypothetical protein